MGAWIDSAGEGVDNIFLSSACGFAFVWAETGDREPKDACKRTHRREGACQ